MDFREGFTLLLLSSISSSSGDNRCISECYNRANYTICYVQSTLCDVAFPSVNSSMDDQGSLWMNFTSIPYGANFTSAIKVINATRWRYQNGYQYGQYEFQELKNKKNVTISLDFLIKNISNKDNGVYDVLGRKGRPSEATHVVVFQHTYVLTNNLTLSSVYPVCSTVDKSLAPSNVTADFVLKCSVDGYINPEIDFQITSFEKCLQSVSRTSNNFKWFGETHTYAYVKVCENDSISCVVNRGRFKSDNESSLYSCSFHWERPSNETTETFLTAVLNFIKDIKLSIPILCSLFLIIIALLVLSVYCRTKRRRVYEPDYENRSAVTCDVELAHSQQRRDSSDLAMPVSCSEAVAMDSTQEKGDLSPLYVNTSKSGQDNEYLYSVVNKDSK